MRPAPELLRLASYGTLAPGRANHHQLGGLSGTWAGGVIRGWLKPADHGPHTGLPGLVCDATGAAIEVGVFSSTDLPAHWDRLDRFESVAFKRITAPVEVDGAVWQAQVYVLA